MKPTVTERRNEIAQRVLKDGHISVRELADHFHVSTETIRKDLLYLEEKNIVTKGHGDAILSSAYQENPFSRKANTHTLEKSRIAERAVSMIPQGGVVLLDSGSTAAKAAQMLNLRHELTIITNSLAAAQALSETDNHLLLLGGELRMQSLSMVGPWAAASIGCVQADIALMGCDGFHDSGPSIRSYRELEIKRKMVACAGEAVLLCDSSKLDQKGLYAFADFSDFSCLITDNGITEEQKQRYSEKMELIIV